MSDEKPLKKPRKAPKKAAGDAPADDPKLGPTLPAWTTLAEWIDTLSEAEMAAYIATPGAARAAYQAALEKRDPVRARLFQAETLMLMQEVGEPTPPPSADPAGIAERDRLAADSGIGRKQISAIENGANTTIETIERLARHLKRTPAELLTKRR